MGDDHFAPVHGKGSMALEFSSEKTITLFNVLYVPKLRKNLVSGPMLNKCGYNVGQQLECGEGERALEAKRTKNTPYRSTTSTVEEVDNRIQAGNCSF
uniref:Zinc finger, CCHC-type n=1 Tax=Tanacetum cinerariifolium TaxID=118510 RepID=A0A699I7J1_TANCI|nr:zinc finger, CCHC-type [Tanacetum cinerariifolium]